VRVPLVPEAKLEDYAALKIEPEPEVSIADEEIDDQLKSLQRQHAEYEQVERSIEMGDQVVAAVIGKADGQEVINMESATLNVTDEMMPPGFAEAIMGANTGDTLEFTLSYPEDFDNEELAGKTVDFMVDISIVRQTTLPPLDDELATKVGESDGIETLTQLRERIAQALFEQKEAAARSRETRAAIDALVSVATVEFPQAALDNEIEQAIQSQRSRLTRMGYEFERYLQMLAPKGSTSSPTKCRLPSATLPPICMAFMAPGPKRPCATPPVQACWHRSMAMRACARLAACWPTVWPAARSSPSRRSASPTQTYKSFLMRARKHPVENSARSHVQEDR